MSRFNKPVLLIALLGVALLPACSGSTDKPLSGAGSGLTPIQSFPLRQGRFSAITRLATNHQGQIIAAGFSDYDCVLMKLDKTLSTLIKMVRFGSRKDNGYFSQDKITDMAVDNGGNIFVCGYTREEDFPVTPGAFGNKAGSRSSNTFDDGFVCKFSPKLELLASARIGGSYTDRALGLALSRGGDVYVTGYTTPCEGHDAPFVTTPKAFDRRPAPAYQSKAFIVRLSNDLSTLKASTFLGGNREKRHGDDKAYDITVDHKGNVWVAGQARSGDFPVTRGSSSTTQAGESDAFVARLDANLENLLAATYLGGSQMERANTILADKQGNVYVGGWSNSPDMLDSVKGYDTRHSRNDADAFIVKFDSRLRHIIAGTFLGGQDAATSEANGQGDDMLSGMTLSPDGKTLYAAGRTESRDFDTTPPSRKEHSCNMVVHVELDRKDAVGRGASDYGDGFVAGFTTDLSSCVFSSMIGGTSVEYLDDMLVLEKDIYIAGETASEDFPGMVINYGIFGSRGFITRLDRKGIGNFLLKQPASFKPQFSEKKLRSLADKLSEKYQERILKRDMYDELGKYAKKRISRERFDAAVDRAFFLYGKPPFLVMGVGLKFKYYNYFQNAVDGYDRIELHYRIPHHFGVTQTYGRMVIILLAKNRKWQLADFQYRGFGSETSRRNMRDRLY
ncbi:MAG: SBBP repeat-containing protein [Desulfobacteraceae bacterium]|jgi:hypothetical protein